MNSFSWEYQLWGPVNTKSAFKMSLIVQMSVPLSVTSPKVFTIEPTCTLFIQTRILFDINMNKINYFKQV